MKHICQGPECHTYDTQSRIRGIKGNKVLRSRQAYAEIDNDYFTINNWAVYFCDNRCLHDWLRNNMSRLINFVGLKTKPSETPIDVVVEELGGWNGKYKHIKIVPKNNLVVSQ